MYYHPISKHINAFRVQYSARQQMKCVFYFVDDDGVAGVGAAVESGADVVVGCEDVNQLTLPFVSPL